MTDRTLGIIYALKERPFSDISGLSVVREYMSEITGCLADSYTPGQMDSIMREAFIDYIWTCDRPWIPVRQMLECVYKRDAERIAVALMLEQVREDDGTYINGFRDLK